MCRRRRDADPAGGDGYRHRRAPGRGSIERRAGEDGRQHPRCRGCVGALRTLFGGTYDVSSSEPLAACQWDMSLINANDATARPARPARASASATSTAASTSPTPISRRTSTSPVVLVHLRPRSDRADPVEMANGDCSNKAAVQDLAGHGTHAASTIAAPVNGIGIAGVAPEATIVALKACTTSATASPTRSPRPCATPATSGSTSST